MRSVGIALAAAALLSSCSGGGNDSSPPPPPPPPPAATGFDVNPCLTQFVLPGRTVAIEVVPDTLTLDLSRPALFPNGRALTDPVIDLTLAFLFLDLQQHPIDTLARIPLGPASNDRPFRPAFPYLAAPQGNPPLDGGAGQNFQFRTDPLSDYVTVDRTGMPALATALIPGPDRNEYNDDTVTDDLSAGANGEFKWVPALRGSLRALTTALADDFQRAGLTMCARRG